MDFGGGEYAPKIHSPLEDPEPPPTSKDMPRCIAATTVMEAPPLEPRLVGVVGLEWNSPWMAAWNAGWPYMLIVIYIYTHHLPSMKFNEAKLVCFGWFGILELSIQRIVTQEGQIKIQFCNILLHGWLTFLWLALILDPSPPSKAMNLPY